MKRTSPRNRKIAGVIALAAACVIEASATAQELYSGFLCCNYRHDGSGWMSDSNYGPNPVMSLGATVTMGSYGRYRVNTTMNGARMSIGNDYSRDLSLEQFAKRIIVRQDPRIQLATFPKAVQDAFSSGRILLGMTKEQVLMALGYPITSETPHLDMPTWRYWLSSFEEFSVNWSNDRVANVGGDRGVVAKVLVPGSAPSSGVRVSENNRNSATGGAAPVALNSNKVLLIFDGDSSRSYEVLGEVSVSLSGRSVYASGTANVDAREEIKPEAKNKFGDSADAVINFRADTVTDGGLWGAIGAGYGACNTTVNASGVAVRFKK